MTSKNHIKNGRVKTKKMKKKGDIVVTSKYRSEIMKLLLSAGAGTYRNLDMNEEGNRKLYRRAICALQDEGLVEVTRFSKTNVFRLSKDSGDPIYEKYQKAYGEFGFSEVANKIRRNLGIRADVQKMDKAFRDAEVFQILDASGVDIYPTKRALAVDYIEDLSSPQYFHSTEFKDQTWDEEEESGNNADENKSLNSRCNGLLISAGGYYLIHHSKDRPLKYAESSAVRSRKFIEKVLDASSLPSPHKTNDILLADTDDVFLDVIDENRMKPSCISVNYPTYRDTKLYAVYNNQFGIRQLRYMMQENWQEKLREYSLNDLKVNERSTERETSYDAVLDDGTFVHSFLVPDLTRLQRFFYTAMIDISERTEKKAKYMIVCAPEQENMIKEYFNETPITIKTKEMAKIK